jgi:hypothetical protein
MTFDGVGADAAAVPDSPVSLLIRGILIVALLALIGFNVFTYLDDITAWFSDMFGAPFRAVARFLGYAAADTARSTVDVTAQGTKSAVDIAAGAATSGIDVLQQTIGEGHQPDQQGHQPDQQGHQQQQHQQGHQQQQQQQGDQGDQQGGQGDQGGQGQRQQQPDTGLLQALSHAKKQPPQPDDATSRTQRSGKSGYCYIGEDRGFRSCIKVGEEDTCMSGDIFPTHAVCINPRLRV